MNISAAYEEWEARTLAEGAKIGEKRGEKRGDMATRIEIAQQLLSKNTPPEKISAWTKLPLSQIQAEN